MPKLLTPQTVLTIPERAYASGQVDSPVVDLPDGSQFINVNMTMPSWPAVSDGTVTIAFMVSRQGGAFLSEWSDTFAHQALSHGGVPVSSMNLGVGLQAPLAAGDRLMVRKTGVGFTSAISATVS